MIEYRRRALELADSLRAALHLAQERRDADAERRARDVLVRLAEDRFQLAVVGQFSRGKSTLMNAIMGAPHLPTGVLPMTSVVTTVRYGSRPRALVHREGGLPIETSIENLGRYVAEASTDRLRLRVASADVEVPAEVLRMGFCFVDTPGVGSAIAANTATTERFLPDADAVVFVTSVESPLSEAEVSFLGTVRGHVGRLFVVVNKTDLVSAAEAAEVVRFVREQLGRHADEAVSPVFSLSARDGLEARVRGDAVLLAASGLPGFEEALVAFLAAEKAREFLRQTARRARTLVAAQRRDLEMGRLVSGLDQGRLTTFEERVERLRELGREAVSAERARIGDDLSAALAARAAAWREELDSELQSLVRGEAPIRDVRAAVDQAGRSLAGQRIDERAHEARRLAIGLAAGLIERLLELRGSVAAAGSEVFGVPFDGDPMDAWTDAELPPLRRPRVEWVPPVAEPWWSRVAPRRRVAERLAAAASAASADYCDRLVAGLTAAASEWTEALGERFAAETTGAARRFLDRLGAPGSDEQLALAADLDRRLEMFAGDLDAWRPDPGGLTAPGGQAGPTGGCDICARLERVQFEHLAGDQWELAVRESRQAEHVETGGFCPLHTWTYAEIASPVGIAAAYARLAASAAAALRVLAEAPQGRLAQGVARLQRPERCPACAVLMDAERSAVAELARRQGGEDAPGLCIPHLAAVLGAGPDEDRARTLVTALAGALGRASEDMRTFALKRESLRRGLLTEEEQRAHRLTLTLLAGRAGLARPPRFREE